MRSATRVGAVVVQHEYGIFGGADGCDLIDIVADLTVPTIIVLHTMLQEPTARQRRILRWLVESADVVELDDRYLDVGELADLVQREIGPCCHGHRRTFQGQRS